MKYILTALAAIGVLLSLILVVLWVSMEVCRA